MYNGTYLQHRIRKQNSKKKISESIQVKAKYFSKNEFNISNLSTISLYPWKMESGYFGRVKIKN